MHLEHYTYSSRRERVIDFAIGFVLWHVANGLLLLLWNLASRLPGLYSPIESNLSYMPALISFLMLGCSLLGLVFNLGGLVYFGVTRHWIALGLLSAWVFYFALTLVAALVLVVTCFVGSSLR